MEHHRHRGHQSLDSTRSRFDLIDTHSIWRQQQQTPRGGGGGGGGNYGMTSHIWSPMAENEIIWQNQLIDLGCTPTTTPSGGFAPATTGCRPKSYTTSDHYTTKSPSGDNNGVITLNSWGATMQAPSIASSSGRCGSSRSSSSNGAGAGAGGEASKYAYYLDRGNGQVTRLIPADLLPTLNEIPKKEVRTLGMEVLQPLKGVPPKGIARMNEQVTVKTNPRTPPSKKDKIYCDKWVHEGICSFMQQGCRYKHVMPTDKATQQSLGLWHGFPPWWKKYMAEQRAQGAQLAVATVRHQGMNGSGGMPETPTPVRARAWSGEGDSMVVQGVGRKHGRPERADTISPPYVLQNPLGVVERPRRHHYQNGML